MSLVHALALLMTYAVGIAWAVVEIRDQPLTPAIDVDPRTVTLPEIGTPATFDSSLSDYAEIIERPLFNATRRAQSVDIAEVETKVAVPPLPTVSAASGMRLSAVVEIGGVLRALIDMLDGTTGSVGEGDRIQGWTVASINHERVVLEQHGSRETLELHDFGAVAAGRGAPQRPRSMVRGPGERPDAVERDQRRTRLPMRSRGSTTQTADRQTDGNGGMEP